LAEKEKPLKTAAAVFIPTLYFAEGLPYAIVNMMSLVLLKNLGLNNSLLAVYTTVLSLPWSLKFLWAPLVDKYGCRKDWIVSAQIVLALITGILVCALLLERGIAILFGIFLLIAVCSATQDIAIDGYYLDALGKEEQAFYVGIRNASYKTALLFGSGPMILLAGHVAERSGKSSNSPLSLIYQGWAAAFLSCTILLSLAAFVHCKILKNTPSNHAPVCQADGPQVPSPSSSNRANALEVLKSFLDQPRIVIVILYIMLFRFGDALMLKMAPAFLLDGTLKGGLGISTQMYGEIYGTFGVITFLLGGLSGGWLVARFGLKTCLMPTAIFQNLAILIYWLLAIMKPGLVGVALANAVEQFAYGLGTAAYTVFLLSTVKEEYKASHYALASALMALGLLVPGFISGYLADSLGYQNFFLLSFLSSIPGIICILYLPLNEKQFAKQT
jgi:PAT family beta-lactamase induction signal transducer AmpG